MESNQWEDQLRNLLGEYKSPDTTSPLGTHPDFVNSAPEDPSSPTPDQLQAWKRIEASLDAADQAFDETINQRVKHFHPKYDPHSWPLLLSRLADKRYLRAKLILLKSVEVAILLLLILSAVNIERTGKLPFHSDLLNSNSKKQNEQQKSDEIKSESNIDIQQTPSATPESNKDFTQVDQHQNQTTAENSNLSAERNDANGISTLNAIIAENYSSAENSNAIAINDDEIGTNSFAPDFHSATITTGEIPTRSMNSLPIAAGPTHIAEITRAYNSFITDPLIPADIASADKKHKHVPDPTFVKPPLHAYTEFAVLAQVDYNALRMPADHLYSSGREIVFPSKGIMSPGYGAGFTIAIGHPIWALETGVIYSAKDFEPGRQLIVGGAFDNGSIKFEAMKLQLVSLPVQYRYRFDHKGRLKSYVIAGGGFHVIAQSNTDVQIKYHFASLSFGEDPNSDPNLAETIKESRRIREHIRDGAPFSTKSFVSINAGLGIEYMLTEHKAIFLQTVAQYQIPNIAFSNNNGKHLRSVSLQAGVRGPLGK